MRCAGEIACRLRRIECDLGQELLAGLEVLRDALELDRARRTHVRGTVNALEMRLEPYAHPPDLSFPRHLRRAERHHQVHERRPSFRRRLGCSETRPSRCAGLEPGIEAFRPSRT